MYMPDVSKEKEALADLLNQFISDYNAALARQHKSEERLTLSEISEKAKVPRSQLSNWMSKATDRKPSLGNFMKLVNYFYTLIGDEALRLYDVLGIPRPNH